MTPGSSIRCNLGLKDAAPLGQIWKDRFTYRYFNITGLIRRLR